MTPLTKAERRLLSELDPDAEPERGTFRRVVEQKLEEHRALCEARLAHVVPIREPLVLVSQVARSGGTLLSQLFDAHPGCHAHPHELHIGHPTSRDWPPLDLARPREWFDLLFEKHTPRHLRDGYRKPAGTLPANDAEFDVFPFLFLPSLQRRIFERAIDETNIRSERDILDCYFTSYFNAWLDNQNLYTTPKRYVTAFAPEWNLRGDVMERFFAAYPDGFLVSIVRDPRGWYASARTQKARALELDDAVDLWRRSVEASLSARERYGDRVVLLTYEQLVRETEATMRALAERLGLTMSPALLVPTFNGRPIRPNSSDAVQSYGIVDRSDAFRDALDASAIVRVERRAADAYARASAAALGGAEAPPADATAAARS